MSSPPAVPTGGAAPAWRRDLDAAITDPLRLLGRLGMAPDRVPDLDPAPDYPCLVTEAFADRMRPGDAGDPLLRQVLPRRAERIAAPGYGEDPLGETPAAADGLLLRFPGRALALATSACPLHCRFCFRRNLRRRLPVATPAGAVDRLRAAGGIDELILSGGDPLLLEDGELAAWFAAVRNLPRLRRLRVHTRVPVALPSRVTPELVGILGGADLPVIVVLHVDHPHELDGPAAAACRQLRAAGLVLLNQATLLRGVNDAAEVLGDLGDRLVACGALPYYLHLLDPARGAQDFAVSRGRARALHRRLRQEYAGYLVPRLVAEDPRRGRKEWL